LWTRYLSSWMLVKR